MLPVFFGASLLLPYLSGVPMSCPAEVKTAAEIIAWAEKEDLRGLHTKPNVSSAEHRGRDFRALVVWYNPYSGEAACHVYVYTRDEKKGVWVRQVARVFQDTQNVSVEFGQGVTIRDVRGAVVGRFKQ